MDVQFFIGHRNTVPTSKGSKNNRRYLQGAYLETGYQWWLLQYMGMPHIITQEKYSTPSKDIGNGLTESWMLRYLNTRPLYLGIEYTPQQHDVLTISNEYLNPPISSHRRADTRYIRFGFESGHWIWDGMVCHANYQTLAEGYMIISD